MVIELWLGMRARDHLEKDRKELSGAMEIYTLIEVVAYLGAYICQNEYNCIPKIRAFHGFWVYNFTSILKKPQIKPSCRASDCQLRSTEGAPSSPNTLRSPSYFGMQIRPPLVFSVSKVNLAAPLCSRHLTCPPPGGGGLHWRVHFTWHTRCFSADEQRGANGCAVFRGTSAEFRGGERYSEVYLAPQVCS